MGKPSLGQLMTQVSQGRRRGTPAGRKGPARPLAVERLEDRCLLSTLQAISLPPANQPPSDTAFGASTFPSVSADGRYVAFQSSAPNLVPGQTGGPGTNVFLLDRTTAAVTLVSHLPNAPTTAPYNVDINLRPPLISRDGRYVVYQTFDDAIVGQTTFYNIVVVYDRTTGQNTLVSHNNTSATAPIVSQSLLDAISPDGRYIVFETQDNNVVPNEVGNGSENLYLYDQNTQTTSLITHVDGQTDVAEGFLANPFERNVSVADNGTVAFVDTDKGGKLITGATGVSSPNVYLYFPAPQVNNLISTVAGSPQAAAGNCGPPVINEAGSRVVYVSSAPNLVPNQATAGFDNVFSYTNSGTTLISGASGSTTAGGNGNSGTVDLSTSALAVSADGRYVAFVSQATDLVPGQGGAAGNVFRYDAQSGALTLLSGANGSATAGAGGDATLQPPGTQTNVFNLITQSTDTDVLSVSDDGSVAFVSQATDLVPGQAGPAGNDNIFLYSQASGQTALVTGARGSATVTASGSSVFPVLSGDGSVLVFHSLAPDLVPGIFDGNGVSDVFTYRTADQTLGVASLAAFQNLPPGDSFSTSVSADGTYTVFTSTAANLVPNQATANSGQNVFLYDQQTAAITLVNHVPGLANTTGDGGIPFTFGQRPLRTELPVISADGSTIAFVSTDDNLVPGEPQATGFSFQDSVYLYDVPSGTVRLVNHAAGNDAVPILFAQEPAVSKDGRYVAYLLGFSPVGSAGDEGAVALYDSVLDTTTLITPLDSTNHGTATEPSISDDGRFVSYLNQGNVYVFDRTTGQSTLVSHDAASPSTPANGASSAPVISHDGSAIAFASAATDLVSNQVPSAFTNVFVYQNDGSGTVSLVSSANGGNGVVGGNGNSDSPAIDADGSYIAYRSDATNLVNGQVSGSNIYEYNNTPAGFRTLVSHVAGDPGTAAGGASEPVIDDDGHLVSYVSTAGNLIPGQSGPAGVKNVFVWLRPTDANILASGQDGSPTVTGNADSDFPLLTRDSFPGFSSKATNLQHGVGGSSVAYINTLVAVSLSPDTVALGSPAGSVVGSLSVTSLLAGQYLPPVYTLPPAEASNALFALGAAAGGAAPLLTEFPASTPQTYQVRVHVNVGFGDDPVVLLVYAAGSSGGGGGGGITARLVFDRVGRRKKTRKLVVQVFDADTGAAKGQFLSPFQPPAYRAVRVSVVEGTGAGVPDEVVVTARKGKKTVRATYPQV